MKRFLIITASVLVLLCAACWAYVRHQQYQSYKTPVPVSANAMIRIDVFGLYRSMAWESFRQKKSSKSNRTEGLSIPANIFCFTVKGKHPTTLFTSLPVSDPEAFKTNIKTLGQFIPGKEETPGITMLTNASHTVTIAYNNTRVAIAFSYRKEEVAGILNDLLLQRNTIPVGESSFKDIARQEGHITYLSGNGKGHLDFDKGKIEASLDLATLGTPVPAKIVRPVLQPGNALSLWLYAEPYKLLQRQTFTLDTFRLSGDSLLACAPEGLTLEIGAPSLQKDTVITYEYNDDFEKVATTTIKETKVPGIILGLEADASRLYSYLQHQHVIHPDSATINPSLFPLYRLYATAAPGCLQFSTARAASRRSGHDSTRTFFYLDMDVAQLRKQQDFGVLLQRLSSLKHLQAKAERTQGEHCRLEATLLFNDDNKNALLQLLSGL